MFLNIALYFKTLRCGCVYFFNLLKTSTVCLVSCEEDTYSFSALLPQWLRRYEHFIDFLKSSRISFITFNKKLSTGSSLAVSVFSLLLCIYIIERNVTVEIYISYILFSLLLFVCILEQTLSFSGWPNSYYVFWKVLCGSFTQ